MPWEPLWPEVGVPEYWLPDENGGESGEEREGQGGKESSSASVQGTFGLFEGASSRGDHRAQIATGSIGGLPSLTSTLYNAYAENGFSL